MTDHSPGAVEAAKKCLEIGAHLGVEEGDEVVQDILTEIIDRLAVQPAVAAAEAERDAYERGIVSCELGRDADPEGQEDKATEIATRIHRLQEPLEDENDALEAERDRLREFGWSMATSIENRWWHSAKDTAKEFRTALGEGE